MKYECHIKSFHADERGSIGIMLGVSIIPLMLLTGIVLDSGKGEMARTSLQASVDAATVAAAAAFKDDDREAIAMAVFQEMIDETVVDFEDDDVDVQFDDDSNQVSVNANVQVDTILGSLFGINQLELQASASGAFGVGKAQMDLVMCIDATGSMQNVIDTAKNNAMSLEQNLLAELQARELNIERLRTRVVFYRDYDPPDVYFGIMDSSPFYDLPDQRGLFNTFIAAEQANGGGNWPEAGLECFNEAMTSDWATPEDQYTIVMPVIAIWTDAPADRAGDWRNRFWGWRYYPRDMPWTNSDLLAKWNNPNVIPQDLKSVVLFGPEDGGWEDLSYYPGYVHGGSVNVGVNDFVGSLADAIAENVSELPTRLVN